MPSQEEAVVVDLDTSSASSSASNADSGRGASDEGEAPTLPLQDYKTGIEAFRSLRIKIKLNP